MGRESSLLWTVLLFLAIFSNFQSEIQLIEAEIPDFRENTPMIPDEITLRVDLALVGYDQAQLDLALLKSSLSDSFYFERIYWEWNETNEQYENQIDLRVNLEWHFHFASENYIDALDTFVESNSWPATTSDLDTDALNLQEETGQHMSIFTPQSGIAINGTALEQYLAENSAFEAIDSGYTIYLLNFSRFDSSDHSQEHWFEIDEVDSDSNVTVSWWRLEWDNALNPHVEFPYPAWGFQNRLYFIDPYCHQWYTKWTEIWWNPDELEGSTDYRTMDLDSYLVGSIPGTSDYRERLVSYLSDWLNDIIWDTAGRCDGYWKNQRSISVQVMMLNDAKGHGYVKGDLDWIINEEILADALNYIIPSEIAEIEISTIWRNLSEFPELETIVAQNTLGEADLGQYPWFQSNWAYLDGSGVFNGFLAVRDNYFNFNETEAGFSAWILLLQNVSMVFDVDGELKEFTGLGGSNNVVSFKDLNRYFASDGETPRSGLTSLLAHELGHVFGLGHAELWSDAFQGAGGFMQDTMSYYTQGTPFFSIFTRDAFYRTSSIIARRSTYLDIARSRSSPERNDTTYAAIYDTLEAGETEFDAMNYLEAFLHYRELYGLVNYLIDREPENSRGSSTNSKETTTPSICFFILSFGIIAILLRKRFDDRRKIIL
ncbi:MAG: hypothetical protein ACFFB3_17735 [Candidatus Hodarchaeota archaeon]